MARFFLTDLGVDVGVDFLRSGIGQRSRHGETGCECESPVRHDNSWRQIIASETLTKVGVESAGRRASMDSHPSRRSALKTLGTVAIASVAPVGADTIQTAPALEAPLLKAVADAVLPARR